MVLDRDGGGFNHAVFRDLPRLLRPGSLLVVNDTRVLRARLTARKPTGGAVQLLLVRPWEGAAPAREPGPSESWRETWEVLATGLKNAAPGLRLDLQPGLAATVEDALGRGAFVVSFSGREGAGVIEASERLGRVPLPPYIEAARRREQGQAGDVTRPEDDVRYQTVYAAAPGAVAAPTAGLHFTPDLLDRVRAAGHDVVPLTLHVGPGTFRPVEVDDPREHRMDAERYEIPPTTRASILRARAEGRPVLAVGTTVVRALEAAARAGFPEGRHSTDLFLMPGDRFEVVTDLITNFHLPRSTLLMLVAAFAGRAPVLAAYQAAVAAGYRFYSYGDAMFIRPDGGARS